MQNQRSQSEPARSGNLRLLFSLAFLIFCSVAAAKAAPQFTASLDRTSVVVGETVTLKLSFEGGSPRQISSPPQIDGLQVASGVSSSVNSTMGPDGTMITVQSYNLSLIPLREGEFVIPAIQANVDGQTLSSQPLTLKVAASDASGPPPEYATRSVFLWLVLPKKELFLGEVMKAELRLYLRSDIRRASTPQISPLSGDGFTFSRIVDGPQFQRRLGNAAFTIVTYSFALTPVKTGSLTVGPITGNIILNPRDPFETFFGGGSQPQQAALTADQQTLQVSPLPTQNVPANFAGSVGQYTMTANAGPTNVPAGDPITLKIQVTGSGQLDMINLPEPSASSDFKMFPRTTRIEPSDPFGVQGTKYFEQLIVPQNSDVKSLPLASFSFFDPERKSYRTLTQPAIPIVVRPGGSTPTPAIAAPHAPHDNNPPASQDIVPIKQRSGTVARSGPLLIEQPSFIALQGVPVMAFLLAFAWRRRSESLANNPRLRRQRHVALVIRDGVNDLHRLASENNSDGFFATLFRLLQEQIGERLDLPASAITEAVIEERLRPRGVSEDLLTRLHELFQTCNLARYAPIESSQELTAIIPRLKSVLRELRELKL